MRYSLAVLLPALALCAALAPAAGQRRPADRTVVCRDGVLRWKDDGAEVALFGVNYYPPFAINYQDLGKLGVDREKVIRDDVAHFVRLGLDLIRLHVWDREISDAEGNLIDNEHLRLLDYLLAECKRNGIYAVLTPIAWWQTDEATKGFSTLYPMLQMTTDPRAWAAQRRYLAQFVQHRNRYTGTAYRDEPAIAAFELINEPLYPTDITDARITAYIDALTGAVREAGCAKPVFYNGWGGHLGAVARSTADGSTFGWYPTGLVAGHALRTNFLPRVADYPDMRSPALGSKARGVYEFDAADVAEGYMYPAMARSFRAGGAQFAAQFQYDPLPVAPFNAGWQTHYLNLVYTPNKALSFLIAADAFRNLPRLHDYRDYPANNRFGEYRVSYEQALSERVGERAFLYSNDTTSRPPAPQRLERIAGCGSSPLVSYDGTGAYFLDRLAPGAWRLEVYPDAVWVADPFGPTAVGREVARVYWRTCEMRVSLPDLGTAFTASPADGKSQSAKDGRIRVTPGVYLLRRQGAADPAAGWPGAPFVAPPERPELPVAVWHDSPSRWVAGRNLPIRVTVAAPGEPTVSLRYVQARSGGRSPLSWHQEPLRRVGPYRYAGTIPGGPPGSGSLVYRILVGEGSSSLSFPGGIPAEAMSTRRSMLLQVSKATVVPPVQFGGAPGQTASAEVESLSGGGCAVRLEASGFGPAPSAAGVRLAADPAAEPRATTLVVRARATRPDTASVEVGLVQDDGQAFGCDVPLDDTWQERRVPLADLRPLWGTRAARLDPARIRQVSLTFGAWLFPGAEARPHGLEVSAVRLDPDPLTYHVAIDDDAAPIPLATGDSAVRLEGVPGTVARVRGRAGPALRVAVPAFGPPPSSTSWRVNLEELRRPWEGALAKRSVLHLRVRAAEPGTSGLEVVLLEDDGAPWGTSVNLTREWQDIRVRLSDLRFFGHWPHPANRGGSGDRFHPERLADANFCFGAWLFPERAAERHAVEIEGVWLESEGP